MTANPGFQLSVDVKGRPCLVIGGEDEAAEKTHKLLEAGAKVTVVNPTLNDALRKLAASAKIIHRGRLFRASDTEGAVLVLNTLRDPDLSRSLLEQAKKERFLLCSSDQPQLSTVTMPALVSRGHVRVAISTSGVAPALASRLRQDLEVIFDEEFSAFVEWLATVREKIQQQDLTADERHERLREVLDGFKLTAQITYPAAWTSQRTASNTSVAR